MKSASIEHNTSMTPKNPGIRLASLKVLNETDSEARSAQRELAQELAQQRPKTRRDCLPGGINEERPCPWYGCRAHLGLEINEDTGTLKTRNVDDMVHTCDLDVAEIGGEPGSGKGTGITLDEVGEIMDLTREAMRASEFRGLVKLKPILMARGLAPEHYGVVVRKKTSIISVDIPVEVTEVMKIPLAEESPED